MKVNISNYDDDSSKREIEVTVDRHDTFSLYTTLANVIYPSLIEFKKHINGAPWIENKDVPKYLWGKDDNVDALFFKRWHWVLDQMIYAFGALANEKEDPNEDSKKHNDKIQNGLRLFAKYYKCLWW